MTAHIHPIFATPQNDLKIVHNMRQGASNMRLKAFGITPRQERRFLKVIGALMLNLCYNSILTMQRHISNVKI